MLTFLVPWLLLGFATAQETVCVTITMYHSHDCTGIPVEIQNWTTRSTKTKSCQHYDALKRHPHTSIGNRYCDIVKSPPVLYQTVYLDDDHCNESKASSVICQEYKAGVCNFDFRNVISYTNEVECTKGPCPSLKEEVLQVSQFTVFKIVQRLTLYKAMRLRKV